MNDLQEVRFGMLEGLKAFNDFALTPHFLDACGGSKEKVKEIYTQFNFYFAKFDAEHVLDVYVFCLSEHQPNNQDGVLSMWRGYGANGAGAALVFKTELIDVHSSLSLFVCKGRLFLRGAAHPADKSNLFGLCRRSQGARNTCRQAVSRSTPHVHTQ